MNTGAGEAPDDGGKAADAGRIRRVDTASLDAVEVRALRALLWAAFPPGDDAFTEDDWQHALGGMHFLLADEASIVAHTAVVDRELHVGDVRVRTGYVEAVAVHPALQGRGLGTRVMSEVTGWIRERYPLGALGTEAHHFYERLGWRTWLGPTGVRTANGVQATPDEDGYILVLRTPTSPPLDPALPITCDWRPGDVW